MDVVVLSTGAAPAALRALGASEGAGTADVVVATDWEATARLWTVDAPRRVFAVDHLPATAYEAWQAERIAAALSLSLPVAFLAAGPTVAAALRELRPDATVEEVWPGAGRAAPPVPALSDLRGPARTVEDVLEAPGVPLVSAGAPAADAVRHGEDGWVAQLDEDDVPDLDLAALAAARPSVPSVAEAAGHVTAALGRIAAAAPPTDRWGERVMGDALDAVAVWRAEHFRLQAYARQLEEDEAFLVAQRARARWEGSALQKVAAPAARRLKARALRGDRP